MAKVSGTGATGPSRKPAPKKKAPTVTGATRTTGKGGGQTSKTITKPAAAATTKKKIEKKQTLISIKKKLDQKYNPPPLARKGDKPKATKKTGKLDEMAQAKEQLKKMWNRPNRLNK